MSLNPAPVRQHLAAYEVLPAMKREAEYFLTRTHGQTTEVTPGIPLFRDRTVRFLINMLYSLLYLQIVEVYK